MKQSLWSHETPILLGLMALGALLAYLDKILGLDLILIELVYAVVVTIVLTYCIVWQRKTPAIKTMGWRYIVLGFACLLLGGLLDIIDDKPVMGILAQFGILFDRQGILAFMEKILGNTLGISLITIGFIRWIPWMIDTRQTLAQTNKQISRVLMSLDDHIEAERLHISRELHDDVAQQLTHIHFQLQLCGKLVPQGSPNQEEVRKQLKSLTTEVSESLKSVRQISRDLRPESLYAIGFTPALEQLIEKLKPQYPGVNMTLQWHGEPVSLEDYFDDRALLHLFRLIQEGTRNALKHSRANAIEIRLAHQDPTLTLAIIDNGVGLPWETMPSDEVLIQEGHLGVVGLKERVVELGGQFSMHNNPAAPGTLLQYDIPLMDIQPTEAVTAQTSTQKGPHPHDES